jgi:hypothetical protein
MIEHEHSAVLDQLDRSLGPFDLDAHASGFGLEVAPVDGFGFLRIPPQALGRRSKAGFARIRSGPSPSKVVDDGRQFIQRRVGPPGKVHSRPALLSVASYLAPEYEDAPQQQQDRDAEREEHDEWQQHVGRHG